MISDIAHSDELQLLESISQFLSSPLTQTLVTIHPNQVCSPDFVVPTEWKTWWDWEGSKFNAASNNLGTESSASVDSNWTVLLQYYCRSIDPSEECRRQDPYGAFSCIPQELKALLDHARRLQLSRNLGRARPIESDSTAASCLSSNGQVLAKKQPFARPGSATNAQPTLPKTAESHSGWAHGMSPKKAHEVRQMSQFTATFLKSNRKLNSVKHVVDVGAGQVRHASILNSIFINEVFNMKDTVLFLWSPTSSCRLS